LKATKFNKQFHPDFLAERKDITPAMMAAAKGDIDTIEKLVQASQYELVELNSDENNICQLACANGHLQLTKFLLEVKSDIRHRNSHGMDVLDLAVVDSIWSPMAKTVLMHYDYVVPEVMSGKFLRRGNEALKQLGEDKVAIARASVIGKTPDFSDPQAREDDYNKDWLRRFKHMAHVVRKGVLLLDSDVGYLERDAMLAGTLEVVPSRRFVYVHDTRSILKFSSALSTVWNKSVPERFVQACAAGEINVVEALLKGGAAPNAEDSLGQTVLMRVANSGNVGLTRLLIHAKASVNQLNQDGYGAFFLAAVGGHEGVVRVLVRAKADIKQRSNKANSALDFVRHEGKTRIMKVIDEELKRRPASKNPQARGVAGQKPQQRK